MSWTLSTNSRWWCFRPVLSLKTTAQSGPIYFLNIFLSILEKYQGSKERRETHQGKSCIWDCFFFFMKVMANFMQGERLRNWADILTDIQVEKTKFRVQEKLSWYTLQLSVCIPKGCILKVSKNYTETSYWQVLKFSSNHFDFWLD